MPKISVIIPAYNSEKFIAETLDNMLAQSLKDIEVVVVNDGSSDKTLSIAEKYAEKSNIFKLINQKNSGVSAARNRGLQEATGEYVVFLDADDYFDEVSLEGFYKQGEKSGADIILGRLRMFDEKGMFPFHAYAEKLSKIEKIEGNSKDLLWNFLVGNKCYKREFLVKSQLKFPGYKYCEEGAFFMACVFSGATLSGTENSVSYYRRHTAEQGLSVSQSVSEELARSFSAALEEIYNGAASAENFFESDAQKEEYLQELLYKTAHILLSQFYRLMWHGDDGCVSFCSERFSYLRSLMTKETYEKLKKENADLHLDSLLKSKKEVSENPEVSVIIKKGSKALLHGIYDQTAPFFEVIVSQKTVEEGALPEEYRNCSNLKVLPEKSFLREAGKSAKGKKKLIISKGNSLDQRLFRTVFRLPLPEAFKRAFFSPLAKIMNLVLRKFLK